MQDKKCQEKTAEILCTAIDTTWIQIFGSFKILVIDGESSMFGEEGTQYLQRRGIVTRKRAPGQHARMIERRGAILRHAMHCIEEQAEREGIRLEFKQLLSEAIFAGNSLISHGGATPYNARFGCQPAMLPDLHALPDDTTAGVGRHMHRMRELALQKIIEATAVERINRAMRTHTTVPGEVLDYREGDLVDFHRPPAKKDDHAWHGPARVLRNIPERGQVDAIQRQTYDCPIPRCTKVYGL
jgi:hypothetical protein